MFKKAGRKLNKGSTLIEMLVCFALLGIFMSAAAVIISNVTNVYFDVKGQTYGRQVADIVMSKISGEIEGAKISKEDEFTRPVIFRSFEDEAVNNLSGTKIDLYDRTDTHIQIYVEDGELKIRYFEINPPKAKPDPEYDAGHKDEVIWTFDEAVYMGYSIKSLRFVPANKGKADTGTDTTIEDTAYKDKAAGSNEYPGNVVGVYLTLESPQYGEFYFYKYVKMYNINDKDADSVNIELRTATDR